MIYIIKYGEYSDETEVVIAEGPEGLDIDKLIQSWIIKAFPDLPDVTKVPFGGKEWRITYIDYHNMIREQVNTPANLDRFLEFAGLTKVKYVELKQDVFNPYEWENQ